MSFLLSSDRLNCKNNNTSNHKFSFQMSHDLATKLVVGKIMYKLDKQYRFYILGQRSTYLFIFHNFVNICGCRCIWDLKF